MHLKDQPYCKIATYRNHNMNKDTAFQMGASNLRFGVGTTCEIGMDLSDMGLDRVLVITDPQPRQSPPRSNRARELGIRRH